MAKFKFGDKIHYRNANAIYHGTFGSQRDRAYVIIGSDGFGRHIPKKEIKLGWLEKVV